MSSPQVQAKPQVSSIISAWTEVIGGHDRHTGIVEHELAAAANLLSEPARAAMLLKLMTGKALPAGELALAANVSAQTASEHLAKLTAGSILLVERQGRHRYYRLAGAEVADAVEALLRLTSAGQSRESERAAIAPSPGSLAHARTCYSHIAGWLGVRIADALQKHGYLLPAEAKAFRITDAGRLWLAELGISLRPTDGKASPQIARQCLDWTERRPHVAGTLGILLYKRFVDLRWVAPLEGTRAIRLTVDGKQELWRRLGIPLR
jgi:DNA-binding transcriptional ArsR family regulator